MVHVREMPEHLRDALVNQELPDFGDTPWVTPKPLDECRIAVPRNHNTRRDRVPGSASGGDRAQRLT